MELKLSWKIEAPEGEVIMYYVSVITHTLFTFIRIPH